MRNLAVLTLLAASVYASDISFGQCTVTELQKINRSIHQPGDRFGHAVALEGDNMAIGAFMDDLNPFVDLGSVTVYEYDGSEWSFGQYMIPFDAQDEMWYGISVSMDEDLLVVGAPKLLKGAVYVYRHNGSFYDYEAKLQASDGESGDWFGGRVSVSGVRILIGALGDDDANTDAGAAYVFHFDGTNWDQEAKLRLPDGLDGDGFGSHVALDDDLAILGAPNRQWGRGGAYVYRFDGAIWFLEDRLFPSDPDDFHYFGSDVAIYENGTFGDIAVVGSSHDDELGDDAGAAHVFHFDGVTDWLHVQKILPLGGSDFDYFGSDLALNNELLVVGGHQYGTGGSAIVYRDEGTGYEVVQTVEGSDASPGDQFSSDLALDKKFLICGAHYDDDHGDQSGSVYVLNTLPDLRLRPARAIMSEGDTLTWSTRFGDPGELVSLFLISFDGIPSFRFLTFGTYAYPSFSWELSVTIPPGVAGHRAVFQAYGVTRCGDVDSSDLSLVTFF